MKISKLTVIIDTFENDAMQGNQNLAIAQCLATLAQRFNQRQQPTKVMDDNGQSVGRVEYE